MDFLKRLLEAGTITQEEYNSAVAEIETLKGQVKSAREEAAQRRILIKDLKKKEEIFKNLLQDVGDKFGIADVENEEEIEELKEQIANLDLSKKVDVTKLAELEAKLKRAEKEKTEYLSKFKQEANLRKQFLISNSVQKALDAFDVFDKDVVGDYVSKKVVLEEDGKVKFKADDGVLLDLSEGLKDFFAKKPSLLKAQGQGGSGTPPNSIAATLKTSNNAQDILKAAGIKN